ncbi:SCO7613 C-terminal domain-containing membrane protein [Streptomyces pseudovenezuelae]|uniref:SCO7613 C-terminal domain-containing membrane protein n=1 Tax=Streptomyces pseudovenezuelae TaxID=67350 RepID=UPI0036E8379A
MSRRVTRTTLQGMTHIPPPAEELRLLDAELWQLDARRAQLLARRAWLVAALQPKWQAPQPTGQRPAAPVRPEASAPSVQNVLLVLGGFLLTVAAMVFTLVSWGHLGIAGRALVLGAVTVAALAAPLPLLRRGLRSTAESVAGLGLALTVLDAVALHGAVFPESAGAPYTAVASTLLAGLWTAYGLLPRVCELRLPRPAGLVAAQLPLFFWAIAADAGSYGLTAALLVTAGFDTVVALRTSPGPLRVVAVIVAYGVGAWGVLAAGWLTWSASGPSAAARAAALLLLASAIALSAAWQGSRGATRVPGEEQSLGLSLTAGLLAVAALGGVARSALPEVWTVPVHLALGIALLAVLLPSGLPETVRRGLLWASGAVQALSLLWTLPVVGVVVLGPLSWASQAWTGTPPDARAAVTSHLTWPPYSGTAPLVLAALAGVLALAVRDTTWRPRARTAALGLAWGTLLVVPAVLELPYAVGLLIQGAATAGALAAAVLLSSRPVALVPALVASVSLAFLSLATRPATLTTLCVLVVLFAAASWRAAAVTAPTALGYAVALACATGAAADWSAPHTALLVLTVPAAAALLAWRLTDSPAILPIELTGAAAALLAIALATTELPMLALVLALCAVITAGTAIREDRRPLGYAAAALFLLAAWVRLAAWEVDIPEAYTLPVTIPALLVGRLRRRRVPETSSWTAYGPGLAATLLPSLIMAWNDPDWTRPLLLGLAALSLTLMGGGYNLQAPLLLGGSVLTLDALHELAPYIVQVADALPRWVPPALAGLLLLALGATYERRIRDVRRMRDFLGSLH